jgi:hypothetical protein
VVSPADPPTQPQAAPHGAATTYRYVPGGGAATVVRMPSSNANGLALDPAGKVLAAEHGSRSVTRAAAEPLDRLGPRRIHGRVLAMRWVVMASAVLVVGCGRIDFAAQPTDPELAASNGAEVPPGIALGAWSLGDSLVSSDDGAIVDAISGRSIRPAGTGLLAGIWFEANVERGLFAARSLRTSGKITFHGSRAVIFLIEGRAELGGTLQLGGGGQAPEDAGPGRGRGGTTASSPARGCGGGAHGTAPDDVIAGNDSDGGGAGGSAGTPGGAGSGNPRSGVAGAACNAPTLEPLIGGSGGGAGGVFGDVRIGGAGGGGGGALQITSATEIEVLGGVDAGGGGGENGRTAPPAGSTDWGGGGGGGAGGAILLEAPRVSISGLVTANGGGGGGDVGAGTGQRGTASALPATGGDGVIAGGAGCAALAAATAGADITGGRDAAGGGGGCGRIRINTSGAPAITGTISPPPTIGPLRFR